MTVYDDQVRYADGETEQFTVIRRANFVTVVAVTAADDLVMVRQTRYATGLETLELPQGAVEPAESPTQAAARELAEETGYVLTRITGVWGPFHQAPDWVEHHFHVVLADVRPGGDPSPDHREEGLVPVVLSRRELASMIAGGLITDASTLAALTVVAAATTGAACRQP